MRLNLIYARARNGVIGRNNTLPWHLPEDMAFFKRQTAGCPVIMGRKTWDSLPPRFRPLPGRTNIVVTRQTGWAAAGAVAASGLEAALSVCGRLQPAPSDAWVIGGAELYALALPFGQRLLVTEIDQDVAGDTYAPVLDGTWCETAREHPVGAAGAMPFAWVTYTRC